MGMSSLVSSQCGGATAISRSTLRRLKQDENLGTLQPETEERCEVLTLGAGKTRFRLLLAIRSFAAMDLYLANRSEDVFDSMLPFDRSPFYMPRMLRPSALERGPFSGIRSMIPRYHHDAAADTDILSVELPGVDKSDVKLEVKDYALHVYGERVARSAESRKNKPIGGEKPRQDGDSNVEVMHEEGKGTSAEKVEHPEATLKYHATFSLAKVADIEAITADLRNGLLTVTVPHKKEEEPRRIELQ
jgi:HSP20 family molecular chaperone IbpA